MSPPEPGTISCNPLFSLYSPGAVAEPLAKGFSEESAGEIPLGFAFASSNRRQSGSPMTFFVAFMVPEASSKNGKRPCAFSQDADVFSAGKHVPAVNGGNGGSPNGTSRGQKSCRTRGNSHKDDAAISRPVAAQSKFPLPPGMLQKKETPPAFAGSADELNSRIPVTSSDASENPMRSDY